MRKYIFLLSFSFACISGIHAQWTKKSMADSYFQVNAFELAAPIYKDASKKTLNGKSQDWEVVRRGALSYMLCQNYTESEKLYTALINTGTGTAEDYHNYTEVLRVLGQYDKAAKVMDDMLAKDPNDAWARQYQEDPNYYTELKEDSTNFKVRKTDFSKGYGDFSPVLYKDRIVFASYRSNTAFINREFGWDQTYFVDTYISSPSKDGKYKSAKRIKFSKGKDLVPHDGPAAISDASNMAAVTMNTPGKYSKTEPVKLGLYYTTVDAQVFPKNTNKNTIQAFAYNNKSYNVAHAYFTADGNTMYFSSDMPGGYGKSDIYKTHFINGTWSQPENLGPLVNTAYDDMFPCISHDGDLYFASKGHPGLGGFDIFIARHSGGNFSTPENLGYPLNTRFDDFGITLNKEGDKAYFTSNRGDFYDRIYESNMYVPEFILDGLVTENDSKKTPLANAEITIKNTHAGTEEKIMSDSLGAFEYKFKKNSTYEVTARKDGYENTTVFKASTAGKLKSENYDATFALDPLNVNVNIKVVDKDNLLPMAGVKLMLKNGNNSLEYATDKDGYIHFVSERKKDYSASLHFHGHKDNAATFNTKVSNDIKDVDLTYQMEPIKKGDVFVIKDIYYDYRSFDLRSESKSELDKLAEFLLENSNIKVELSSHTDARGTSSSNKTLSQKRAQSCVNYLISKGVPKANIVAKGYGEDKLINRCKDGVECSEEEHQQNRRTEIKILSVQ